MKELCCTRCRDLHHTRSELGAKLREIIKSIDRLKILRCTFNKSSLYDLCLLFKSIITIFVCQRFYGPTRYGYNELWDLPVCNSTHHICVSRCLWEFIAVFHFFLTGRTHTIRDIFKTQSSLHALQSCQLQRAST